MVEWQLQVNNKLIMKIRIAVAMDEEDFEVEAMVMDVLVGRGMINLKFNVKLARSLAIIHLNVIIILTMMERKLILLTRKKEMKGMCC